MNASAITGGTEGAQDSRVERRSGVGLREFVAEYRKPRRPLVLADAAAAWPLYGKASPDWFRAHHGDHVVRVRGRDYRLAELLDLLQASTAQAPPPYPCKFEIAKNFRALLPEVSGPRCNASTATTTSARCCTRPSAAGCCSTSRVSRCGPSQNGRCRTSARATSRGCCAASTTSAAPWN